MRFPQLSGYGVQFVRDLPGIRALVQKLCIQQLAQALQILCHAFQFNLSGGGDDGGDGSDGGV